jgi:OmpR family response regulator RpaB
MLKMRLSLMGYKVFTALNGEQAFSAYKREILSLIILDILIFIVNTYSLCQEILRNSDVSIIILVEYDGFADKITGSELGVIGYILKPFSFNEIEIKILSILNTMIIVNRITGSCFSRCVYIDALWIDIGKRQVYKRDEKVRLTSVEFNLLRLLVSNSGEIFSRSFILQKIWGYKANKHIDTRVVDVHVSRLRSKLENDPGNPDLILTARGVGYAFQKIT